MTIFVPMKARFLHLIIYICTILALSACNDSLDIPDEPEDSVAIIYWMGDNNLSSWAEDDITELVQGKDNIPANSKIVIYVDKSSSRPIIYQLDAKNGLKVWKEFTQEQDCTDSLTLLTNLRDIIQNFPAKKYGLTFGAHGSGMVINRRKALGPDWSHNNNWLNIPTLRGILERLPHMSYIFFDVCFMQSIEGAYELRNVTDWIIGSPAEIPNPGAPYHIIEKDLCTGNVQGIINGYDGYYPVSYKGVSYKGTILSAVDCSQLGNLANSTRQCIENIFANRQTLESSMTQEIQKYSSEFSSYTYCYDMNSAMHKILSEDDYSNWSEAFKKAIPIREYNIGRWTAGHCSNPNIYDEDHFGGISMYFPQEGTESEIKNNDLKCYQWYKDAGWSETGW